MFSTRSFTPELLDQPHIPFADIRQNMRELDVINTLLGGHRITLKGLRRLAGGYQGHGALHVAEIGCGDGNNLRVIDRWAKKQGMVIQLTGIDYNSACIGYALELPQNSNIRFICSDYRKASFTHPPHIVFSSLFCHHFADADLVDQLRWMAQNSTLGFFINDLHRHPFAYHSIRLLTRMFSKSYLVKNDAPLSVLRGFSRAEWHHLLAQAGISAELRWEWAFRWLVVAKK